MPRLRQFEEAVVLDGAVRQFWWRGFNATSVRDIEASTGIGTCWRDAAPTRPDRALMEGAARPLLAPAAEQAAGAS